MRIALPADPDQEFERFLSEDPGSSLEAHETAPLQTKDNSGSAAEERDGSQSSSFQE